MQNLFEGISNKNKDKILKSLEGLPTRFTKGINIISYMNRKNTIGIINSGSIEISINNYNGDTFLLDELGPNDIFGSVISSSILNKECTIITREETNITFIDFDNITNKEIVKNDYYIKFIENFLKIISEQTTLKNERIEILIKKTIRDRLLTYFDMMAKKVGVRTFTIPYSLSFLANYLATDRSAMMREIKNLNTDGLIISKGRKIRLMYQKK